MRVKDALSVSTEVSVIERSEHSDHEVRDKAEVVSPYRAYDDVIDWRLSHSTPSCDGYDFWRSLIGRSSLLQSLFPYSNLWIYLGYSVITLAIVDSLNIIIRQ